MSKHHVQVAKGSLEPGEPEENSHQCAKQAGSPQHRQQRTAQGRLGPEGTEKSHLASSACLRVCTAGSDEML